MSRSFKKSCNDKGGFCTWANSESNKKDKKFANKTFRSKSKQYMRSTAKYANDLDEIDPVFDLNQVSNTWSFSSDGLAQYIKYDKEWTNEDKRKLRMK